MESIMMTTEASSAMGDDVFDPNELVQSSVHQLREIKPIAVMREHDNSVDCISANPANSNEFATGSHDKSIKIWDVNQQKSVKTLLGHKEGVWCINYNKDGTQLVTASPEGIAKLWDPKTGKAQADLTGHTKRVFWATYSNAGTHIATCGSDRLVLLWDLRKTAAPIAQNNQSESVVLSCEFLMGDEFIVTTNLEGDVNVISQKDSFNIVKHETIYGSHHKTNSAFCCQPIRNAELGGTFLVGADDKHIHRFNFDPRDYELEKVGTYVGHSNSVRNIQVSKDCRHVLSCCEDHSLRLWDFNTYQPLIIFSGHRDNVSGAAFINANTVVSSSWDLKVMLWKF